MRSWSAISGPLKPCRSCSSSTSRCDAGNCVRKRRKQSLISLCSSSWSGRLFLRVLSVGFLAAFILWITPILVNAPALPPGARFAPLLRFQPYNPQLREHDGGHLHSVGSHALACLGRSRKTPVVHRLHHLGDGSARSRDVDRDTNAEGPRHDGSRECGVLWWLRPRREAITLP